MYERCTVDGGRGHSDPAVHGRADSSGMVIETEKEKDQGTDLSDL